VTVRPIGIGFEASAPRPRPLYLGSTFTELWPTFQKLAPAVRTWPFTRYRLLYHSRMPHPLNDLKFPGLCEAVRLPGPLPAFSKSRQKSAVRGFVASLCHNDPLVEDHRPVVVRSATPTPRLTVKVESSKTDLFAIEPDALRLGRLVATW
jgi:hypothetical protein